MSTIADTRAGGTASAPLTPADVECRLIDAEAQVARCTDEHHRAAFEAEVGAPGAEERLALAQQRLQDARARVVTLQGALVVARQQEERARARIQAKLRKDNIAKITANLEKRDAAAERLAGAIQEAASAWRELLDYSAKAVLPVPGVEFPHGSLTALADLRREVEREMFRMGSTPGINAHHTDFPGAKPHDIMVREQPEAIPPMADTIKSASRMVLARIQGETLGAAS